ncbi:MAG: hypothetical protein DWI02_03270 [Planctomycetota bacterium]|nr:MAG: hypothetical protein DWI02_03270 [Planctomycetota bacterium]
MILESLDLGCLLQECFCLFQFVLQKGNSNAMESSFFALGLFMLLASSANAGLIISVQSPSVGTAQVRITSNSSDDLGQLTAVFDITSNASNAVVPVTSLEFVSPADYLTNPTLNAGNLCVSRDELRPRHRDGVWRCQRSGWLGLQYRTRWCRH